MDGMYIPKTGTPALIFNGEYRMTDTERLNLIEHYKWEIRWLGGVFVHIVLHQANTYARGKTLREAIDNALAKQAEWALGIKP